jgi:hypothetical protein
MALPLLDCQRSFLRFSTTRVNHTPRLAIAAACTLTPRGGSPATYYLTCPCIGEAMYVPTELIHLPVSEFRLIAAPGEQFLLLKRFADAQLDVCGAFRCGEVMPTHDGRGARVVELAATVRPLAAATPITGYAEFRAALLDGRRMVGITTYTDPATGDHVRLDYPADTVNIAHDRDAWQVDAGPLVLPALAAAALPVARLRPAYLVYNRWDYAEFVSWQPTALPGGATTCHYGQRTALACQHQLFATD